MTPLLSARLHPKMSISTEMVTAVAPTHPTYANLLLDHPLPGVVQIKLNRPRALNALSTTLINDLNACLTSLLSSQSTRVIVLTGSPRAFSVGADIHELRALDPAEVARTDFPAEWSRVLTEPRRRCPVIAAVNGIAFGGGCELALMADVIYCNAGARFALPEVRLGLVPGAGGTQKLARMVGKTRAMEMVLTGCEIDGVLASQWGIAAKVFESCEQCVEEAVRIAGLIAGFSPVAVRAAMEVVNFSQEVGIREGLIFERSVFQELCAGKDSQIGLEAFVEKKEPQWVSE